MSDYEVVIAGGGHNALACAAVLCQAGIRTLVAERNEWVGGGAVTRELTLPGFKHDLFGSNHVWIHANPYIRDLMPELKQYGLEYLWGDPHLNFIAHSGDEIAYGARGALCELLNRHDTHTQVLMPVDADAFVVVAPAAVDFSKPEQLETARAFRVSRYQCFALHRGTWHWGPYPVDRRGSVRLLNVQGRRYREDNGIAWLARDRGVVYEVIA